MLIGLVLAAGASRRMGQPKALLTHPSERRTFVTTIVRRYYDAGIDRILIVARPDDRALAAEVALIHPPPIVIENLDPERGQLSSLVAGLDAAEARGADAVIVMPVDMPQVAAATVAALATAARDDSAAIVRATHAGRHGHPVIFRRSIFAALRAADPAIGAKAVLREHAALVRDVDVDDPGVLRDVDRPEDYERLFGVTLSGEFPAS